MLILFNLSTSSEADDSKSVNEYIYYDGRRMLTVTIYDNKSVLAVTVVTWSDNWPMTMKACRVFSRRH